MKYFLVDYENVKKDGLDGVVGLDKDDVVTIFYSKNAESMNFGLHRRLNEATAAGKTIQYQKVEVGEKNALDFQLASFLGYIIKENEVSKKKYDYYIVTNDKGFTSLVNYWKRRNVNVEIVVDLTWANEKKVIDELKEQLAKALSNKTGLDQVASIIKNYKTKQGIHNALIKAFPGKDNKTASEIYNEIKPLIADKKGK
ncbi:MAG: PIN domain-containing protein [Eubacteriales bacterium]|nr:PIN domain-containing protein [Eubacteriales bacterium]